MSTIKKRFVVGLVSSGFYGPSYDICGHGKTLTEAIKDLKIRASEGKYSYCFSDKNTLHSDTSIKATLITEDHYDIENGLSNIINEKAINLKYPIKWNN